ncbi:MAG: aldo/keto reductase [Actinomycetota bacterium]
MDAGLGLGTWALGGSAWGRGPDRRSRLATIERALEIGVRSIDTAPAYGEAEELLGEVLGARRDQVELATKIGPGHDPEESLGNSLRNMRIDHVDVLFLHECLDGWESQLESMSALRERGLATELGISNATPEQISRGLEIAPLEIYQGQYNLVDRDVEERHLPLLRRRGLGFWAYRPLASGLLAGGQPASEEGGSVRFPAGDHRGRIYWFRGRELERRRRVVAHLAELAVKAGSTVAALALGWVMARPGVSVVLAGSRTVAQLDEAAAATALSSEEVTVIDGIVGEAFRPPRATSQALASDWGERERFVVERLDGEHAYERIAAEWSSSRDQPMVAAQVKVFADDLAERGLVSDD